MLPLQGAWIPFLVSELRSYMPHCQKKERKNVFLRNESLNWDLRDSNYYWADVM